MASTPAIHPSADFREAFARQGGAAAARCYQCAACSSVCELAPAGAPFPRRQVLWAQWGLIDRLAADPGPWLCHQCNDCSLRCPRDVAPGDLMAAVRATVVERLAAPAFLGSLVADARRTWPLLVLLPLLFWLALLAATTGLAVPEVHAEMAALEGRFHYQEAVPHLLIYVVYTAAALWSVAAIWTSGRRFWRLLGLGAARRGSFLANLVPVVLEIAAHRRFARCDRGVPKRRWGHFLLMWGFAGAALTSAILVVYLYGLGRYPLPLDHWVKWLGNLSALALLVGGTLLYANRLLPGDRLAGATSPADRFFLYTVLGVIATGVLTELLRFVAVPPAAAVAAYLLHLAIALTLFLTFPYCKFAHLVYRTLAMVHERMAALAET
jgi:quinone-modifying oxidoreductase subunit QmoC